MRGFSGRVVRDEVSTRNFPVRGDGGPAFSRFTWIYMLGNKSNALQTFIHFKTQVESQFGYNIKAIKID